MSKVETNESVIMNESEIKEEIEDVLREMCAGRNREWSEDMIDRLYDEHIKNVIWDDWQSALQEDREDWIGRLSVDKDMVISALFAVVINL